MQYKNYLPYATSTESPPPGLITAFSFSLRKKKKKRPKENQNKKQNSNTSEHFGTKKWHPQELIFYL